MKGADRKTNIQVGRQGAVNNQILYRCEDPFPDHRFGKPENSSLAGSRVVGLASRMGLASLEDQILFDHEERTHEAEDACHAVEGVLDHHQDNPMAHVEHCS
jgi:inorganic pyrophosphatase/exopolyphosphatase